MKIRILLLVIISCVITSVVHGQHMQLQAGNKNKIIQAGSFIRIELPTDGTTPCDKCERNSVLGQLIASGKDSIEIRVHTTYLTTEEEENRPVYTRKSYVKKTAPHQSFAKSDILSITMKGREKLRNRTAMEKVGLTLFMLGPGQLASAAMIDDADQGNTLILAGLGEMVAGIAIARTFRQRPIVTSENCPDIKEGKRVWTIK